MWTPSYLLAVKGIEGGSTLTICIKQTGQEIVIFFPPFAFEFTLYGAAGPALLGMSLEFSLMMLMRPLPMKRDFLS